MHTCVHSFMLLLLFFISPKMKTTIKNMNQNKQDNNKQIIKREKTIQKKIRKIARKINLKNYNALQIYICTWI